jgi:hypothetical protein
LTSYGKIKKGYGGGATPSVSNRIKSHAVFTDFHKNILPEYRSFSGNTGVISFQTFKLKRNTGALKENFTFVRKKDTIKQYMMRAVINLATRTTLGVQ